MTQRYRKKPIEIEVVRWTGDNAAEVTEFCGRRANGENYFLAPEVPGDRAHVWNDSQDSFNTVTRGDWIIRGARDELYPCEPNIFAATYEPCEVPA